MMVNTRRSARGRILEASSAINDMTHVGTSDDDAPRNADSLLSKASIMDSGNSHDESMQHTIDWNMENLLPLPSGHELSSLRRYTEIDVPVIVDRLMESLSSHGMILHSMEKSGEATIVRRDGVRITLSLWIAIGGTRDETATGIYLEMRPSRGNMQKCSRECNIILDAVTRPSTAQFAIVMEEEQRGNGDAMLLNDTLASDANQNVGTNIGNVEMSVDDLSGGERNVTHKSSRWKSRRERRHRGRNGALEDAESSQVVIAGDNKEAAAALAGSLGNGGETNGGSSCSVISAVASITLNKQCNTGRIPRGLVNPGLVRFGEELTCYSNVAIQCIACCPAIRDQILCQEDGDVLSDGLRFALQSLLREMQHGSGPIEGEAKSFKASSDLFLPQFGAQRHSQHDATEYLHKVLHCVMSERGRSIFRTNATKQHSCTDCCKVRGEEVEELGSLRIQFSQSRLLDVKDGLRHFFHGQKDVKHSMGCHDQGCNGTATRAHYGAVWLADILFIEVHRLKESATGTYVEVGLQCCGPEKLSQDFIREISLNQTDSEYHLFAIIHHTGGYGGGHYYAYVKHGNDWFRIDDDKVQAITTDEVTGYSSTAYSFMYHKTLQPDASYMALGECRHYGMNEMGSRLRAAPARKEVSFDDLVATAMTTPRVQVPPISSAQKRNATPYSHSCNAASTATASPTQEQDDSTAPLPHDLAAETCPVHSTGEPPVFENAAPFVDTCIGRGTLVAHLAHSTLGVTSVPPPTEPTRGYVRIEKNKKPKDTKPSPIVIETVEHEQNEKNISPNQSQPKQTKVEGWGVGFSFSGSTEATSAKAKPSGGFSFGGSSDATTATAKSSGRFSFGGSEVNDPSTESSIGDARSYMVSSHIVYIRRHLSFEGGLARITKAYVDSELYDILGGTDTKVPLGNVRDVPWDEFAPRARGTTQPGHDGHSAGPQQNERQAESDNDVSSLEFGEDDSESDNDRSISSNSSESSESDHDGSIFSSGSESNEGDSEPNNDRSSFSSGSESSEDDWDSKDGPGGSNRHFSQAGNSYQCTAATNVEDSDDASVDSAENGDIITCRVFVTNVRNIMKQFKSPSVFLQTHVAWINDGDKILLEGDSWLDQPRFQLWRDTYNRFKGHVPCSRHVAARLIMKGRPGIRWDDYCAQLFLKAKEMNSLAIGATLDEVELVGRPEIQFQQFSALAGCIDANEVSTHLDLWEKHGLVTCHGCDVAMCTECFHLRLDSRRNNTVDDHFFTLLEDSPTPDGFLSIQSARRKISTSVVLPMSIRQNGVVLGFPLIARSDCLVDRPSQYIEKERSYGEQDILCGVYFNTGKISGHENGSAVFTGVLNRLIPASKKALFGEEQLLITAALMEKRRVLPNGEFYTVVKENGSYRYPRVPEDDPMVTKLILRNVLNPKNQNKECIGEPIVVPRLGQLYDPEKTVFFCVALPSKAKDLPGMKLYETEISKIVNGKQLSGADMARLVFKNLKAEGISFYSLAGKEREGTRKVTLLSDVVVLKKISAKVNHEKRK